METVQQPEDMTSIDKSADEDCSLEKHFNCSICMQTSTNFLTTSCGQSFCKRCLELSISSNVVKTHVLFAQRN
ncbi:hypothetical protein ILYODFUR_012770 [Ilyodon furcidens]|uniref:Zinc finger C3HC4 RING-type domain-containing protein n=1 Tax=Ilyodon furcidens TaxID=33524 RepID=A0ABV0U678_9TELE